MLVECALAMLCATTSMRSRSPARPDALICIPERILSNDISSPLISLSLLANRRLRSAFHGSSHLIHIRADQLQIQLLQHGVLVQHSEFLIDINVIAVCA